MNLQSQPTFPAATDWEVYNKGILLNWRGSVLEIAASGFKFNTSLVECSIQLARTGTIKAPVSVDVRQGQLIIRIINKTQNRVTDWQFRSGKHLKRIRFKGQAGDQIILFVMPYDDNPVECRIDWGDLVPSGDGSEFGVDATDEVTLAGASDLKIGVVSRPEYWSDIYAQTIVSENDHILATLEFDKDRNGVQSVSHNFPLERNHIYQFTLTGEMVGKGNLIFFLVKDKGIRKLDRVQSVVHREIEATGEFSAILTYTPPVDGCFRLGLLHGQIVAPVETRISGLKLDIQVSEPWLDIGRSEVDTLMPNWGPIRRTLHRLCKRSRTFNSFVAAMEMRLGHEEIVSLPMYVSLCPTGQCNALCDFCSVTINRTGIIKRQLPWDRLEKFLGPTLNTVNMYGIEGNGEPTLYKKFHELTGVISSAGADSYLITNGSRITPEMIPMLLNYESVTFSVNAATAETHKRVMKLKDFGQVVWAIKTLVKARGLSLNPRIYVSFVVYNYNVHELPQFLEFAERELGADVIMIRPLSELGTDAGAVEDLRDLPPYESDVKDALDATAEYLGDTERRHDPNTHMTCEIRLDPSTFRNVRPDPMDKVIMPYGFEDRLLAPRRDHWSTQVPELTTEWRQNILNLSCPEADSSRDILLSALTPVEPGKVLTFSGRVLERNGAFRISIVNADGDELAEVECAGHSDVWRSFSIDVQTAENKFLGFRISQVDGNLSADIDFERLRTPGPGIRDEFKLPAPERWMVDSPGVKGKWTGHALELSYAGKPGPYLLKSYSCPCVPNTRISLPLDVEVRSGTLVVGVLSEDFQSWVGQFPFEEGRVNQSIDIDPGDNSKIQIVLFSKADKPLDIRIDWGDTLEQAPDWNDGDQGTQEILVLRAPDVEIPPLALDPAGHVNAAPLKKPPKRARRTYYCQKPWTDLNNFTVDGRMDVCCIATGASQERYALGNVLTQNFQEIWNGPRMKEFRRTVNSDDHLPPCARCPMSYAYQGLFFDRVHTKAVIQRLLRAEPFESERLPRGVTRCLNGIAAAAVFAIEALHFRGFRE